VKARRAGDTPAEAVVSWRMNAVGQVDPTRTQPSVLGEMKFFAGLSANIPEIANLNQSRDLTLCA